MKQNNNVLNIADYRVIFDTPKRLIPPLSWVQHIPFAFFLIELLKPRILVELGTHSGNSYNSFCQVVKRLMLNTKCYAVDTWKGDSQAGFYDESVFTELKQYQDIHYQDFSTLLQMSFKEGLCHFNDNTIDLLHIDGYHSYESVKHDLVGWLPKMSNTGVILFHDTIEKQAGFGVWKLWNEISSKYPSFNFTFGHGLGVLAVGNEVPQKVINILEEFRNNDFYGYFFESVGLLNELRHLASLKDTVKKKFYSKLVIKTQNDVFDDNSAVRLFFDRSPDKIVYDVGVFEGIRSFRFHPHNEAAVVEIGNVQLKYGDGKLVTCKLSGSTAINPGERKMIFENQNSFFSFDNPLPDNQKIDQVIIQIKYFSKDKNAIRAIINKKNQHLDKVLNSLQVSRQELKNEKRQNDKLRGEIIQLHSNLENKTYINKLNDRLLKEKNNELKSQLIAISEKNKEIEDKKRLIREVDNANYQMELTFQKVKGDLQKVKDELYLIKTSKAFKLIAKSREIRTRIKLFVSLKSSLKNNEFADDLNLIQNSELFNHDYYISSNPDLNFENISPAEHYLTLGGFQKRNPSQQFDSNAYLTINSDVAELEINPLLHYLKYGKIENRRIEPLPHAQEPKEALDIQNENPAKEKDVIKKTNVIFENKIHKQIQQIRSSGVFDENYYLRTYSDVRVAKKDPVGHFVKYGADESRNPNASFDTVFYKLMYLSKNEKINPLFHWLTIGQKEGYCTNWDSHFEKVKSETASTDLLFISHDASVTGAPKILLDIIEYVKRNTLISFKIIMLHGGPWMQRFISLGDCLVYSELINEYPEKEVKRIINRFIGNKIKVVYLNTIVSLKAWEEIVGKRDVSAICHVHELQKTFEFFDIKPNHLTEKVKHYIAASPPVKENLVERYKISGKKVDVIFEWINPQDFDFSEAEKLAIRNEMNLPSEKVIVYGCGSFDYRKGADIFVEAAYRLKKRGNTNFVFCWIGDIYNDFGYELIERSSMLNIGDVLIFSGIQENPARCFLAGDIFLLPSREDPFPLVCLEAANARLPVICFEGAGGMPSFVKDDAGFVIPFENIEIMVQKIQELFINRTLACKMGECGYNRLLSDYSAQLALPKVVDVIKTVGRLKPKISVIVPNYNYGRFLQKRLDSIFNQSFSNFEVIILDDASTDYSIKVIDNYRHKKNVKVLVNTENSGSAFNQWAKGIEMATGDLIWVAEADDFCDRNFLPTMVKALENPDVVIAYSNSYTVDSNDKITGDYQEYYKEVDSLHWQRNYTFSDTEEINVGLGIKNTIPNASAVVFRKDQNTLEFVRNAAQFMFSGDWYLYLQLLKGKKISFINARLNYHRKHDNTITKHFHKEGFGQTILDELQIIHRYVLKNFIINQNYYKRWEFYVREQVAYLFPSITNINQVYDYDLISGMIKAKQQEISKVAVFVSNSADASGAPQNLLALVRHFSEFGKYYCITFSHTGGLLLDEFMKFGEAYVINSDNLIQDKDQHLSDYLNLLKIKPVFVLVNTISCGNLIPVFKGAGLKVISFIHDYTYAHHKNYLSMYYEMSDLIVFSTEYMLQFNKKDFDIPSEKTVIIPQGLYKTEIFEIDRSDARNRIRKEFAIDDNDCIVLGCGSIDARKGVDIFINTAIQCLNQWNDERALHFIWLGGELKSNSTDFYHRFLARDLINSGQLEYIHFINTTLDVAPYYVAADLFFLSSREDPFPTVVHEAMAAGLPIVGFKNAGGAAEYILRAGGKLVGYQHTYDAVRTIIEMLNINSDELEKIKTTGKEIVTNELSYMNYYQSIVSLLNKNQFIPTLI